MGSSESDVKYPWPSTVNVPNFVTVKPCLKEEERLSSKFNIWKEQMLCLLESQNVLGFVDGEIPPPEKANTTTTVPAAAAEEKRSTSKNVETEQKLMWRRTDRLVKGWILGSIGNDALDTVWKLETARDVWLELNKIFNHEAAAAANSELQPESDSNAQKEDGGIAEPGGELNRHLPLYKAAQRGDWESAKNFFNKDKEEAAKAVISYA